MNILVHNMIIINVQMGWEVYIPLSTAYTHKHKFKEHWEFRKVYESVAFRSLIV